MGLLQPLTSCKIYEGNLTILFIDMTLFLVFGFTDEIHGQDGVRSGRVLVQLVASLMPILDALVKDSDQVLDAGALNDHEVLNEEAIFRVPSSMQNT